MFRFSLIYSCKNISHEFKTDRGVFIIPGPQTPVFVFSLEFWVKKKGGRGCRVEDTGEYQLQQVLKCWCYLFRNTQKSASKYSCFCAGFFLFFIKELFFITCYLFCVIDLSAAHRPWAVLPLKLTRCEFSRIEPEGPKVSTQVPGPESVNLLRQLDEIQVKLNHVTFG